MAHTDTNVLNLKLNRGTKAVIDANLGSIGEDELIFLTDKSVPIPADKVGSADSVDKGKVVSVDANGNYELTTPSSSGMTNPMTTAGDIIVGGSSGTPERLAKGTDGQVLKMVSGSPAWSTDNTGMSNPMTTAGDLIIGGSSGAPSRLAKGTNGNVLKIVNGSPAWSTDSVGMTNPMTTAGDIIVGGSSGFAGRLGKGANGTLLGVNDSGTLGYKTGLPYTTTEPTSANTDGIKIVVLSSEPATKYSGYLYLITGT